MGGEPLGPERHGGPGCTRGAARLSVRPKQASSPAGTAARAQQGTRGGGRRGGGPRCDQVRRRIQVCGAMRACVGPSSSSLRSAQEALAALPSLAARGTRCQITSASRIDKAPRARGSPSRQPCICVVCACARASACLCACACAQARACVCVCLTTGAAHASKRSEPPWHACAAAACEPDPERAGAEGGPRAPRAPRPREQPARASATQSTMRQLLSNLPKRACQKVRAPSRRPRNGQAPGGSRLRALCQKRAPPAQQPVDSAPRAPKKAAGAKVVAKQARRRRLAPAPPAPPAAAALAPSAGAGRREGRPRGAASRGALAPVHLDSKLGREYENQARPVGPAML